MSEITIYHNPRCSKSRQTLQLLEDNGKTPNIRLYLEAPPSEGELKDILKALNTSARGLLRKGEDEYKALNLSDESLSEDELIKAMHSYPRLIERPIVLANEQAVIGRPPENVLNII